jgi:hypothetical protein
MASMSWASAQGMPRPEGGNANASANDLQSFINQVEALVRSGRLSAEDGQRLIDAVRNARDQLIG